MNYDFNEANILNQNLHKKYSKSDFLDVLRILLDNTMDDVFKDAIRSLIKKVSALSPGGFTDLCDAVESKKLIATMNDVLGGISVKPDM